MHRAALVFAIATLNHPAAIFRTPSAHTWTRHVLPMYTPLSHQRLSMPVLGRRRGFLKVLLPGRPNGHTGWILARKAKTWKTPWHVVVDTRSKRLFVFKGKRIAHSFPVVVGKGSTPTPRGRFYVEEALILKRHSLGGPYAFALSARSKVFQEFEGARADRHSRHLWDRRDARPRRVARLHPRDCGSARFMVRRFGTGTPVDIR